MPVLENERHEKYVQNLLKGMSQRKAYRDAFPSSKSWKNSTVDSKASHLLNGKVLARYEELQNRAASKAVMTAQERLEYLTGIVKETETEHVVKYTKSGKKLTLEVAADLNTKIKAIDVMNRMQGEYTTKIEGEVKVRKLEDLL